MVELVRRGVYLLKGGLVCEDYAGLDLAAVNGRLARVGLGRLAGPKVERETAKRGTMAFRILAAHNTGTASGPDLALRFDALASHDITYVAIIQTARASGLAEFPVPYVLTNCHNSLCAVGGTINQDDHVFGLSAAKKYGGIFVPAHQAVIHQYVRETMAGCGRMILGSDSHTRYGSLGTMGIGEGGPEIVKQLLGRTYDLRLPEVVAVYLEGSPVPGVGPQDVALAIIRAVFAGGWVKNKVLEFVGPGIAGLPVDFRNGIDVMTTETACLSSIWTTDELVGEWYRIHGRPEDYRRLQPEEVAYYDGMIRVDLSRVEPMIALPFHPSLAWPIAELNRNAADILREVETAGQRQLDNPGFRLTDKVSRGRLKVDQGVVAGCAGGTFGNVAAMAEILEAKSIGNCGFDLSVYPASQPVFLELMRKGCLEKLMVAGCSIRSAFCGPCFGAGDIPANRALSARHVTRNFPNREGSRPADGQWAAVALMDARSIAATAVNGGLLTAATEIGLAEKELTYSYDPLVYANRVYQGYGRARKEIDLVFGPNIADWPEMTPLPENLLLKVAAVIHDPVTTTDELIPSGETSSFRSNPLKLAEFTLIRRDPGYVGRAKAVQALETGRRELLSAGAGKEPGDAWREIVDLLGREMRGVTPVEALRVTGLGSVVCAVKPGDGSAREQAASCQRVLGGRANIAVEYATRRYRANLVNWGLLPFTVAAGKLAGLAVGDFIFIPGIRRAVRDGGETVPAYVIGPKGRRLLELGLQGLSEGERDIILAGSLINFYARQESPWAAANNPAGDRTKD